MSSFTQGYQAISALVSPVLVLGMVSYWFDATYAHHQGWVFLSGLGLGFLTGFYAVFKRLKASFAPSPSLPATPSNSARAAEKTTDDSDEDEA
jgi:F0F1-type ATP synthase assembly protein I